MNSPDWKKIFISGIIFAVLAIMLVVGVYLIRKPQSQSVTSKAAALCSDMRWPADPGTTCGKSTQQPVQNATGVSLTPDFQWGYGGYRTGETGCVDSTCTSYKVSVMLSEGSATARAFARADIPRYGTQATLIKSAKFSDFFNCDYGNVWPNDPNTCHTDRQSNTPPLKANTTYYWKVEPTYDGVVHAEQTWNYTFTTGTGMPTIPDCTSLTTTADLNNLQVGTEYSFQLTAGGTAPITSVEMSVYGSSCSNELRTYTPQTVSGQGTYVFKWTPTQAGSFTAYGRVWNDGIAECRADCIDGPPRYLCSHAAACKLTGTVKTPTQTVGCNQACNITTLLCSSQYDCTGGKCVSKICPTTQDSSCACPISAGSCQRVTASKDLSTIKIGDTVTFTGFGTLTNPAASDSIDKINFIISKDGAEASNTEVTTTLDSAGVWKATKDFSITSPGSYSVRIRVHWLSKNSWLE